uniref:Uncharacterized protein n=1 Tax=Arundo donax TaxID=35708 RepID=A0A0A9BU78_ARUDO
MLRNYEVIILIEREESLYVTPSYPILLHFPW